MAKPGMTAFSGLGLIWNPYTNDGGSFEQKNERTIKSFVLCSCTLCQNQDQATFMWPLHSILSSAGVTSLPPFFWGLGLSGTPFFTFQGQAQVFVFKPLCHGEVQPWTAQVEGVRSISPWVELSHPVGTGSRSRLRVSAGS